MKDQIREDFHQKYPDDSERDINGRVKKLKVKDLLTGDKSIAESDNAEFVVEDAIEKIMINKPGLLRRGLEVKKVGVFKQGESTMINYHFLWKTQEK